MISALEWWSLTLPPPVESIVLWWWKWVKGGGGENIHSPLRRKPETLYQISVKLTKSTKWLEGISGIRNLPKIRQLILIYYFFLYLVHGAAIIKAVSLKLSIPTLPDSTVSQPFESTSSLTEAVARQALRLARPAILSPVPSAQQTQSSGEFPPEYRRRDPSHISTRRPTSASTLARANCEPNVSLTRATVAPSKCKRAAPAADRQLSK